MAGAMQVFAGGPVGRGCTGPLCLHQQRNGLHCRSSIQLQLDLPRQQGRTEHGGGCPPATITPGAIMVALSPGWVQTDMGGSNAPDGAGDSPWRARLTIPSPMGLTPTVAVFSPCRRPPVYAPGW